ncbi:hypothetical protein HBZC1_07140 [Helicobacter bizzozeronii CIII-1]|uniref:Uncharacterized protein n=1 Tax=Helicobacter bizzozeronii (strain CIII-1) TaxID=1002804 RepID=F8KSD1_HELBC|nr:hypothetical protein HBZC1_07140 [Helicobacter bizzozeronii CIII-1]
MHHRQQAKNTKTTLKIYPSVIPALILIKAQPSRESHQGLPY